MSHNRINLFLAASDTVEQKIDVRSLVEQQFGESIDEQYYTVIRKLGRIAMEEYIKNNCNVVIPTQLSKEEEKQGGEALKKILQDYKIPVEKHTNYIQLFMDTANASLTRLSKIITGTLKETAEEVEKEYYAKLESLGINKDLANQIDKARVTNEEPITVKLTMLIGQVTFDKQLKETGEFESYKKFMSGEPDSDDSDEDIEDTEALINQAKDEVISRLKPNR